MKLSPFQVFWSDYVYVSYLKICFYLDKKKNAQFNQYTVVGWMLNDICLNYTFVKADVMKLRWSSWEKLNFQSIKQKHLRCS
jgi:hypothetical protein